ncbi:hypothetical protein SASC598O02_003350 [Snodgrassella alvi SCGC AB-598-O02]|nr:hypothetical protein SASC598O02_003350 [Snodgrassella alvi SCGC AB-598-O02]
MMISNESIMVKINKLFNLLVAVLILSYSSIALSTTNLEALRDSFLCKGVNSRAEQAKLLKPFILKQERIQGRNLITLKQPIVFGNIQSNLVALNSKNEIDELQLLFKVDYRKVQENLPVKVYHYRILNEDLESSIASVIRDMENPIASFGVESKQLVLAATFSPEYPTALICIFFER